MFLSFALGLFLVGCDGSDNAGSSADILPIGSGFDPNAVLFWKRILCGMSSIHILSRGRRQRMEV